MLYSCSDTSIVVEVVIVIIRRRNPCYDFYEPTRSYHGCDGFGLAGIVETSDRQKKNCLGGAVR